MRTTQFYVNIAHGGCDYNPDTKRFAPLKIPPNVCVVFLQESMTYWSSRHGRPNNPAIVNSRLFGVTAGIEGNSSSNLDERILKGITASMNNPIFLQLLFLTRSDDPTREMQDVSSVNSYGEHIYPQANFSGLRFRTFYPGDIIPDVSYVSANATWNKLGFYKLDRGANGAFTTPTQSTGLLRGATDYRLSEIFTKLLASDRTRHKTHVILNWSCLGYMPSVERYPDGTFKLSVPSRNHTNDPARAIPRSAIATAMNVGNVALSRYGPDELPVLDKGGVRYHLFGHLDRPVARLRLDLTMGSYAPGMFEAMQRCFPGIDFFSTGVLERQKYLIIGVDVQRSKFVSILTSSVEPKTGIFYIWNVCKDGEAASTHRGSFEAMMSLFRRIFVENGRYAPTFSLSLRFDNPIFAKVLKVYAKAGFDRISELAPMGGDTRANVLRLDTVDAIERTIRTVRSAGSVRSSAGSVRSLRSATNNNNNSNNGLMNVNATNNNNNNNNNSGLEVVIIPNTNRNPSRLEDLGANAEVVRGLRSTYTVVCKKSSTGAFELAFGMRRRGNRLYVHNILGNTDSLIKTFEIVARRHAVIENMPWSINFPIHDINDATKANLFGLADWGFDTVSTRTPWISPHEFFSFVPEKTIRLDMNY